MNDFHKQNRAELHDFAPQNRDRRHVSERVLERANHQAQSSAHWCTAIALGSSNASVVHQ